jgi:hypothetical protein
LNLELKKSRPVFRVRNPKPSPSLGDLLMAEARELLTTWEVLKNKATIDKRLALCDQKYGLGSERKIRDFMHRIKKEERFNG